MLSPMTVLSTLPPTHIPELTELWQSLHLKLSSLGNFQGSADEFDKRLNIISRGLDDADHHSEDANLFTLVQMLFDDRYSYSAINGLLCAFLCRTVAPRAGVSAEELDSLAFAALTMNLSMSRVQDALALQAEAISDEQRQIIQGHPAASVDYLRSMGVRDPLWLELVQDHHESSDGKGYPSGKSSVHRLQSLLRMTDLFVARISLRKTRRGQAANVAVRDLYLEAVQQSNEFGPLLVKSLGMFPPGTYVKLKSGEIAVVVKAGEKLNTPPVVVLTNELGVGITTPFRCSTDSGERSIEHAVPYDDIRVRIDTAKILRLARV
jgi:HD-GYP domain-containing protein (c-di-GMP phosphodiesterase class II)